MLSVIIALNVFLSVVSFTASYSFKNYAVAKVKHASSTKLFENFSLDFKNPKIESSKEIFTEKQLREFTATYSVDERFNPFEILSSLFKKDDAAVAAPTAKATTTSAISGSLKSSVSLSVLEEKTALYVKGKSDAKTYYGVLKAAFGNNLPKVLPEILANLPADKAAALSKL
mmetsp:Transcript_16403/g.22610  ORF Transcript_16403/g.22610 Transcript_16403/m.22610 type:complete len:172 (+) Transcript_16403:28-543(+)|eukprot:CAMPEP_0170072602 /NCGR_PEP_ID=MMETSP0019_2-20121128/10207_1 /TAXON_ID=98059 /ORGANISM="Dinobryon sp., Strain UTEXLB2267" /LENGTH=171 /DNA_ID=CAMNT_0010281671 /DNA_START=28 /DNA_END=546 /DNA_ORIENTATION=-